MNDKVQSARDKIARLRQTFLEQLPQRLAEGQRLFAWLQSEPHNPTAIADLHRFFHGIKGTSRSFGFQRLGELITPGDDMATRLLLAEQEPFPEHWQETIANCLDALIQETGQLLQQPASSQDNGLNLPGFSLSDGLNSGARQHLIYLCDDDPLQSQQLATQLSCFGYRIQYFTSPQALQQAMQQQRPRAIIMDIDFPEGKSAGLDALTVMDTSVPTIFLSARHDFEARLRSVQTGGSAYFQKPTRTLDIIATLDALTQDKAPDPFRVLIVDDDPHIAQYHAVILQQADMITQCITDPPQVLDALQNFRPDMVLMDMYMPCCTGHDIARMIRQMPEYISLPIVFLSSETDQQKQFSALRTGAEDFLTKPVSPEALITAVSVRAERMRILRALMARDGLTGLYNHTTTTEMLDHAIHAAQRQNTPLCFAMIDIDHFKHINDTYGHPTGDQVILAIARVLQQRLRSSDIVGRYGGEEFTIILPGVTLNAATEMLNQLREDFAKVMFYSEKESFSCTFSAGVACFKGSASMEALRSAADNALYRAKKAGRNCVIGEKEGSDT